MDGFYTGDMSTYDIPKFFGSSSDSFKERKLKRTEFYFDRVYKNKLVQCTACSGYRYYCGHACGCCDGTGKMRQR